MEHHLAVAEPHRHRVVLAGLGKTLRSGISVGVRNSDRAGSDGQLPRTEELPGQLLGYGVVLNPTKGQQH
jgi:hypothetical protein